MSIDSCNLEEPAIVCAQAGCRACLEALMHRHEGLVHVVLRQQARGGVPYEDLLQEGRIALWQAILHFDPHRGVAFSTYAWVAIQRRIWRAVARANRPQGKLPLPEPPDPLEAAAAAWWMAQARSTLAETLARLPGRLREVIVAAYGLDEESPRSLAAIGRRFGVSREQARQWRNDALLLLRLPVFSARLRRLCDQDSRAAYARTQALNRAWLQQRRGRRRR